MASAKTAPQAPLDKMQVQVGSVLFQLGKIFMYAHQGDGKALEQAKAKAAKGIPDAKESFHQALTQIEEDVAKASRVIRRDLEQLREKRAAREKAAGAARLQANAANAANGTAVNGQSVKKEPESGQNAKGDSNTADLVINGGNGESNLADASNPMSADIDDLFGNDTSDTGNAFGNSANQQGGDPQGNIDDLFGDNGMSFEDDFGMSADGGGDGFSSLLPGIQDYANHEADSSNTNNSSNTIDASSGQATANATDDVDLDVLLNGMVDNTSNDAPPPQEDTSVATKVDQNGFADINKSDNGASASNGANQDSKSETAPVENAIDPNMMELTFDFDDFQGASYDGTMSADNDEFFTFD